MKDKTILVVDDAPENLDLLVGLLKDNYNVKAAINGKLALKIAQAPNKPDVILLDIVMPDLDGLEVCRRLKSDSETADIPIIFLSGQASSEDCDRGLELGGAAYLHKPVDPGSLFSLLDIVLPDPHFS